MKISTHVIKRGMSENQTTNGFGYLRWVVPLVMLRPRKTSLLEVGSNLKEHLSTGLDFVGGGKRAKGKTQRKRQGGKREGTTETPTKKSVLHHDFT